MEAIFNLFLAILAGIISYALIEAFVTYLKKIAIPWYQGWVYGGHHIEGEWLGYDATIVNGTYQMEANSRSTIVLKQQGTRINGELLLTKQPNGEECRKIFELRGNFIDTVLVLNVKAKDSNNMGVGTFIMKLGENGDKLKGKHTYISAYDWSTVFDIDQVWARKSSHQPASE